MALGYLSGLAVYWLATLILGKVSAEKAPRI